MKPTKSPEQMKRLSRGWSDDMSPAAVQRRMEIQSQLYQLWLTLKTAKPIGPEVMQSNDRDDSTQDSADRVK